MEKRESGKLEMVKRGFESLKVSDQYKQKALKDIEFWLEDSRFEDYRGQIVYLIESGRFELLLDSFYQVLPFGTGGRRGPVGVGPNRLNPWTIQASAQGHSEYLLKKFGEQAKKRGVVLCYDVRKYPETGLYTDKAPNPVKGVTSKDFALHAAQVYAANGIKCHFFDAPRSTPELSFAIRHLNAVSGIVISASHNPKEDNGKKIYSADGGQLIPPEDQKLADMVNDVEKIEKISIEEAKASGLLKECGQQIDDAYLNSLSALSLLGEIDRSKLKIIYSPLHGTGTTSIQKILVAKNFNSICDERTSSPDGSFPNVKFNIPNPEVMESMETLIEKGKAEDADILINSDPDADRLGMMVRIHGQAGDSVYRYFSGNEIGIVLAAFILDEKSKQGKIPAKAVVVKTTVTSELITKIAKAYDVECMGELLVGFKYIGNVIKKLEDDGQEERFVLGLEESHGYLVGTYCRDKDAAGAAFLLCELAAHLKQKGKNIADYLDHVYKKFGYYTQRQVSLIFLGAEGREKIETIVSALRNDPPKQVAGFKVAKFVDRRQGEPFLSETDKSSRNVVIFLIDPGKEAASIKITARPSGTEPKIKIYLEVGGEPIGKEADDSALEEEKQRICQVTTQVMDAFTRLAYNVVNIEMPERGFRLSSLLPVEVKQKYFEVEKQLLELEKETGGSAPTRETIERLLAVFGKDPVEKISDAFREKTGMALRTFLRQKLNIQL